MIDPGGMGHSDDPWRHGRSSVHGELGAVAGALATYAAQVRAVVALVRPPPAGGHVFTVMRHRDGVAYLDPQFDTLAKLEENFVDIKNSPLTIGLEWTRTRQSARQSS